MHQFVKTLRKELEKPLPGKKAQDKMLPSMRIQDGFSSGRKKESAILILLYFVDNDLYTCLIKRANDGGAHSGQISFPGGKREETDRNDVHTATREAEEEVGVIGRDIKILGELTKLFIPISNFCVVPIVGYLPYRPTFIPDKTEVDFVIETKIKNLLDEEKQIVETFETQAFQITAPCFLLENHFVWGATAMIMSEFSEVVKSTNLPL